MRNGSMEEIVQLIFSMLASVVGVYSLLIIVRIIISWFGGSNSAKPVQILCSITDPYLNWWRRTINFRFGVLDFSPMVGVAALSVIQTVLYSLSRYEIITVGNILAIILVSVWSIVSFLLGFCFIIIVFRLIAYLTSRDMYSPFWRVIDTISQPILYRLNRLFFGNKVENFTKGIYLSLLFLAGIWIGGRFAIPFIAGLLSGLPF